MQGCPDSSSLRFPAYTPMVSNSFMRLYKGSLRQILDHSWISVHVYRLTVHHHLDYPLLDISEFSRLGLNALDNRQPRSEDCTCKSSVSS